LRAAWSEGPGGDSAGPPAYDHGVASGDLQV